MDEKAESNEGDEGFIAGRCLCDVPNCARFGWWRFGLKGESC